MLQKYFPILEEINSPLAMMAALQFTSESAEIAVSGISNQVLETLLKEAIEETAGYKKEVVVAASELAAARKAASKTVRAYRYRAAQAARSARAVSKNGRQIKAVRKPIDDKASLRTLKGLDINICRQRAVEAQVATRTAANTYNAACTAVEVAIEGGDIRTIRTAIATLKAAVRELEVRHLEFRFAREMVAVSLARHSA